MKTWSRNALLFVAFAAGALVGAAAYAFGESFGPSYLVIEELETSDPVALLRVEGTELRGANL